MPACRCCSVCLLMPSVAQGRVHFLLFDSLSKAASNPWTGTEKTALKSNTQTTGVQINHTHSAFQMQGTKTLCIISGGAGRASESELASWAPLGQRLCNRAGFHVFVAHLFACNNIWCTECTQGYLSGKMRSGNIQ